MDGTENQQDTSARDSSEGTQGTSEAKTYTEAEHQKGLNDRLAAAGRTDKQLSDRASALSQREADFAARQVEWQKQQDEAELEEVRDNPTEYEKAKARQKSRDEDAKHSKELADREAAFEKQKADWEEEHGERVRKAEETELVILIWDVAEKTGANAETLKDLGKEYKIEPTKEAYEKLARQIGKPKEPVLADSGRTIGGGDTSGMTPEQKVNRGLAKIKKK